MSNTELPVPKQKKISCASRVTYHAEPPELTGGVTTDTWVESTDFAPPTPRGKRQKKGEVKTPPPYLIIGFDTEFKTPEHRIERDQIVAGLAKYRVLSYQFHAKTSDGIEWQGICCPKGDERMSLGEFVVFALGLGARSNHVKNFPSRIYLVGHFTRADVPAFRDFKDLTSFLSSVRNTFISTDVSTPLEITYPDGSASAPLNIFLRDTMLLTPQAARSLKAIGTLVGQPKLVLDPDPAKHKTMIQNMDKVRAEHWNLFKSYALNDATICVRYVEKIISQYEQVTGNHKVPVTLTSIGVDLLKKTWEKAGGVDARTIVGRVLITEEYFSKKLGHYVKTNREAIIEEAAWYIDFVTESYHGGRNEQYWFGPCFEDDWSDYDLSSAYPTAMALIGMPKWTEIYDDKEIHSFTPTTLGFTFVDFEFPPDTRFPTLPVRTSHGLIFPLKGRSYCSSPELHVARRLGAKIKINKGVIVPTDPNVKIFGPFIKDCLDRRIQAGSKTLEGLFWKEISNSTYGKTAQGLRPKRVYDMRDRETKELPVSPITNPFFASYITSFTRAVLGEIINSLPPEICVFSCTTDGFISNASEAQIAKAQEGDLCRLFRESRESLTGMPSVLEKKHSLRKPLGWRTRGQATLVPGTTDKGDEFNIVLAKGGIFTPPEFETVEQQNDEVRRLFFDRTPDTYIHVEGMTGVRDMVEHNADLVEKVISKRLSMEYDWKRQPRAVKYSTTDKHILFSTRPWKTAEQFAEIRGAWETYTKKNGTCIKTREDFDAFATHVESHSFLGKEKAKYLKKVQPDVYRVRQQLCSAWKESKAGLIYRDNGMNANGFAAALTEVGIPCKRSNVENAHKKSFAPHSCPPTVDAIDKLTALKKIFPSLEVETFLFVDRSENAVTLRGGQNCPFVSRCD